MCGTIGHSPAEFYEMTYAEVALAIEGYGKRFPSTPEDELLSAAHDGRPEVDPVEMVAAMIKGAKNVNG